jgi:Ca2+-binding EF-hand superfamily protein
MEGIKNIGVLWKQLDDDRSGGLSYNEFEQGLINHNIHMTREEIKLLFDQIDTSGDGRIDYNEFLLRLRVNI